MLLVNSGFAASPNSSWTEALSYFYSGFESLTWVERFQDFDTFEMMCSDIDYAKQVYPIGSRIILYDSDVPMRVETHDLVINEDGAKRLKVSGRGFESILAERELISDYAQTRSAANFDWVMRIASFPRTQIGKAIAANITTQVVAFSAVNSIFQAADVVPNTMVSYTNVGVGQTQFWPQPSMMNKWDYILPIMQADDIGIKCKRPTGKNAAEIIPSANWNGGASTAGAINNTRLEFNIFTGTDRSASIVLSVSMDHFTSERYFDTVIGKPTSMLLATSVDGFRYSNPAQDAGKTGWDRRWTLHNLTDRGSAPGATTPTEKAYIINAWVRAMYANQRRKPIFEGEITKQFPFRYGIDFNLGDYIGLQGRYDFKSRALVTEWTRIQDKNGYYAFPTLVPS